MAVYTNVSHEALNNFLSEYDIGSLDSYQGITEGVENSNYLLTTSQGRYILTLFEKRMNKSDLPFFMHLTSHLAEQNIPCPLPIQDKQGTIIKSLCDKPAIIISFLQGKSINSIHNKHLTELGTHLGQLHQAGLRFTEKRPNDFSLPTWKSMFEALAPKADAINPYLAQTVRDELDYLDAHWPTSLPTGVIHADLFPDNVFFKQNSLSGIIDFYFACTDFLMYDIAICLNAWCFEHGHEFNITKARLLLSSYYDARPFSPQELDALPVLASGAAMRFLLTRLHDWVHQSKDALVVPKDPMEYLRKLQFHKGLNTPGSYGFTFEDTISQAT